MVPNFDLLLATAAEIQGLKVQPCSLNSVMIAYIIWFSPVNGPKKIKMLPSAKLRYTALLKYVPDLFCWSVIWRLIALTSVILPSGTAKAVLLHMFQVVWCTFFSFPLPFNLSKTPSCSLLRVTAHLSVQIPARMALSFPSYRRAADTSHFSRRDSQTCLQPGDVLKWQKCPTATQGEVGPSCKPACPSGTVPQSSTHCSTANRCARV